MHASSVVFLTAVAFLVSPGRAQSTISPDERFAYSSNAGWMDFRPGPSDGVVVSESILSGKGWSANLGWIDFGDGSPANGYSYSNATAADFGINLDEYGRMRGFAYGANVGWIVFEQKYGLPRLNFLTGVITGHAWAANLGWISLATADSRLATIALALTDSDDDGMDDAWEKRHFSGSLTAANRFSDADGDSVTDLEEFRAGTNPKDPASRFRIVSHAINLVEGTATVEFTSSPNRIYRIETAATPAGSWSIAAPGWFEPSGGTTTTRGVTLPGGPAGFLRGAVRRPLEP